MSITSEAKQEVVRLLNSGQKIEAVKYLQETFQISLSDAKTLVEAVEAEMNLPVNTIETIPTNTPAASETELWGPLKEEVKTLLIAGKKIEAVKLVRVQFRKGLKEALDMVEVVQKEIDPSLLPASSRSGCAGNLFKIVAAIFGFVTFILLGIAALIYYMDQDEISKSDRIQATVVDLRESDDGMFTPVIRYQYNGREHEYTSNFASNPPDYAINEVVFVYVNRENPEKVIIDSFSDRWLGLIIVAGLGLFFGFFTIILAFAGRRF
jgi:ribosomal protein L7/L12